MKTLHQRIMSKCGGLSGVTLPNFFFTVIFFLLPAACVNCVRRPAVRDKYLCPLCARALEHVKMAYAARWN